MTNNMKRGFVTGREYLVESVSLKKKKKAILVIL